MVVCAKSFLRFFLFKDFFSLKINSEMKCVKKGFCVEAIGVGCCLKL